jgi:hypothetical protein
MAKATTTIRQMLNDQTDVKAYFAANQALFNRVAAFYFDVIQAHMGVLDLGNMDALRALEQLTHTTELNPHPVMPLSDIEEDIPAMFHRAAINAALGSARSFYGNRARWQKRREKYENCFCRSISGSYCSTFRWWGPSYAGRSGTRVGLSGT